MSWWLVLPAWLSRITWSTWLSSNWRSFLRMVSGEPIRPDSQRLLLLPVRRQLLVLLPEIAGARRIDAFAAVVAEREDEERPAGGLRLGLLVGRRRT